MLKVRCNTTDILCCMLGEMWKQQQLKAVCGTQPVFHYSIFFSFCLLMATLTYCSYPFLSLAPSESFFCVCVCRRVVTDNLCRILTYASFLHFLCIFFALCAGWLLVDSVSLFMHVLNDSEWMRMACLLDRSVSEPKLSESGWAMSGLPILRVTSLLTSLFFFYLVAAYLPSRLISNEASS